MTISEDKRQYCTNVSDDEGVRKSVSERVRTKAKQRIEMVQENGGAKITVTGRVKTKGKQKIEMVQENRGAQMTVTELVKISEEQKIEMVQENQGADARLSECQPAEEQAGGKRPHADSSSSSSSGEDANNTKNPSPDGANQPQNQDPDDATQDQNPAPDGGWGWVVTAAGVVMQIAAELLYNCNGLLYSGFLLDAGVSQLLTSWIFTSTMLVSCIIACLVGPLVEEFGWRAVAMVSSVVYGVSLTLSGFATSPWQLVPWLLLACLSSEILRNLVYLIITYYFTKKRVVASALVVSGVGINQLLFPIMITYLFENYGFKGSVMITGAIVSNACVAAMVFHPVEWHAPKGYQINTSAKKDQDEQHMTARFKNSLLRLAVTTKNNLRLFSSPSYVIISNAIVINIAVFFNLWTLVPFAMHSWGFSRQDETLCMSVAGGFNLVARLAVAFLAWICTFNKRLLLIASVVINILGIIGFALLDDLVWKVVMLAVCGASCGMASSLYYVVALDYVGLSRMTTAVSNICILKGLWYLLVGPVTGVARDISGNFVRSFNLLAGALIFVCLLLFLMPAVLAYERRSRSRSKKSIISCFSTC